MLQLRESQASASSLRVHLEILWLMSTDDTRGEVEEAGDD
jgi:hypothetical protein